MIVVATTSPHRTRLPATVREQRILDVAAELFYRRGVHDVGMDELVKATGLGKASVYRVFASKDALITAYLARRAETIFGLIDADIAHHEDPRDAIMAIIEAVEADVAGPSFRGCAFNNASIEFGDPANSARTVAREYREGLQDRLINLATTICGGGAEGKRLGEEIALIIEGMYLSAAHLGSSGPARRGRGLVLRLLSEVDHAR